MIVFARSITYKYNTSTVVRINDGAVRQSSNQFIASLTDQDFHRPASAGEGLSIGHWLFITVGHGALHIGKIQLLRNMLEGKRDNPC
jgi:hypothetical protein